MNICQVEDFSKNHLLFGEPYSEQLVASGFHHDWPDARGVFLNGKRDVLGWINQVAHPTHRLLFESSM